MKEYKQPIKVSLGLSISFLAILLFASCSVLEPLPGLCYTDKTGTYLCDAPANSQQHEVPTSYEPKSETINTINTQQLRESLVCMEEQDHGIFIDVCKGVVIIPINTNDEDKE